MYSVAGGAGIRNGAGEKARSSGVHSPERGTRTWILGFEVAKAMGLYDCRRFRQSEQWGEDWAGYAPSTERWRRWGRVLLEPRAV